jgi:hypothetical protein
MNLLLAAQSGWGKSFKAQHVMEENIPEYRHVVVLDFKDEYRGLVKAGLADWWIAGPKERKWRESHWRAFLEQNPKVVLARHDRIDEESWREIAAAVISAARNLGDVLVVVDEAHFVAPQRGKVPDAVRGLATTGRGEGASSVWVSQRLSEMEETVLSQCQARLLGGFESSADLSKVDAITEYPTDLHNPQVRTVRNVPEELLANSHGRSTGPDSLQRHEDDDGNTIGSEWIYSDNSGDRERRSTRGLADEMVSTHFGAQGKNIKV